MDGEIKIPVCNCGCNETKTAIGKFGYERLFIATMQCTNCGFIVSAIETDFDRAEKSAIEKWCLWLKTKDYPVWTRGKKMQTDFDWDGFKQKQFAVICETDKEQFFADCKQHGIHCFLSEFAKRRNLFVCVHLYENRLSNGRYELVAFKGWETKPNGLYGKDGLEEVKYEANRC